MSLHPVPFISSKIPYDQFVKEGVMRLGAGGTMVGWKIAGPGHETSSQEDTDDACLRFAHSLGHFTTGDFCHLIVHRTKALNYRARQFPNRAAEMIDRERAEQYAAANYYQTIGRFYAANQDESYVANQLKALFFGSTAHRMQGNRELQMKRFFDRVEKWEDAAHNVLHPVRMTSLEMFRDLLLCVNGTGYEPPLPRSGAPLRHIIGQQDMIGGSLPQLGQIHARPITLVYPWPKGTSAQAMAVLMTHRGELTLSCRYICLDQVDALRMGGLDKKHYDRIVMGTGFKHWFANAFNLNSRSDGSRTVDQDTAEQIAEIDAALAEMQGGMPYGFLSICVVVRGEDFDEVNNRTRTLTKDLEQLNYGNRIEDAAAVDAIEGSWPGQGTGNDRRPLLSAWNYAELSMPVHHWQGTPEVDSSFFPTGTPVPLQISGSGAEPFNLPSHIRSVGHILIVGPTTAGKSTLLGAMVAAYTALEGIRIIWLDRDYSSFVLTHAMGGSYIELAGDDSSPLCPFATLDHADGAIFLFEWTSRLLERWNIQINERQAEELHHSIELARDHGVRTMSGFIHIIHDQAIRGTLNRYTKGHEYGHVFDGDPYDVQGETLRTYEMRRLDSLGDRASEPAQELIIREAEVGLGAAPTLVVWDEASWALRRPTSRQWLDKGFRTFRKYNGAFVLSTQSLQEVDEASVRALLLESTAIKIFLPNPYAKPEQLAQILRPKEMEMVLKTMVKQQDYLAITEYGSRVFRLNLGRVGRALAASTGADSVAQAREILKSVSPQGFLDEWLAACGLAQGLTHAKAA